MPKRTLFNLKDSDLLPLDFFLHSRFLCIFFLSQWYNTARSEAFMSRQSCIYTYVYFELLTSRCLYADYIATNWNFNHFISSSTDERALMVFDSPTLSRRYENSQSLVDMCVDHVLKITFAHLCLVHVNANWCYHHTPVTLLHTHTHSHTHIVSSTNSFLHISHSWHTVKRHKGRSQ